MKTLEIVEILEKAKVDRKDAINLAEAINGQSGLATKEDVQGVKHVLSERITRVESSVKWLIIMVTTCFTLTIGLLLKIAFF